MTDDATQRQLDELEATLDPSERARLLEFARSLAAEAPAPGLPAEGEPAPADPGTSSEPAAIDNTQPNENTVGSSSDQPAVTPGEATESTPATNDETVPAGSGAPESSSTPPSAETPAPAGQGDATGEVPSTADADVAETHTASDAIALLEQAIAIVSEL